MRVFSNTTTIRSHVLVGSFVENYTLWTYHGEKSPPPMENPLNEIIQDAECNRLFDAYDDFDDVGSDDKDVGGGYGDGIDGPIDDGDFLSQLLHHTKAEILDGSAKGLAKFKMVKKLAEEKYIRAI
jgi:hypothetical protein